MLKADKEDKSLLDLKEKQRKHREMQTENEENVKQIEKLKTTCFQLANSVEFEQEKNKSLKKEIQFRKKHFENTEKNYLSFKDKHNPESKIFVMELKKKLIKDKLTELLTDSIPELNGNSQKDANVDPQNEKKEFNNLIIDHVVLTYVKYEGGERSGFEEIDKQV